MNEKTIFAELNAIKKQLQLMAIDIENIALATGARISEEPDIDLTADNYAEAAELQDR